MEFTKQVNKAIGTYCYGIPSQNQDYRIAVLHECTDLKIIYGMLVYRGITADGLQTEISKAKDSLWKDYLDFTVDNIISTLQDNGIDCHKIDFTDMEI